MKRMTLFILVLLLASCAPKVKNDIVSRMSNTYEKSDEYRSGFVDGCSSGLRNRDDSNHMYFKDLNRYTGEYRLGWDVGLKRCSQ